MLAPRLTKQFNLSLLLGSLWLFGSSEAINLRVLITSGAQVSVKVPNSPDSRDLTEWQIGLTDSARGLTLNGQDAGSKVLYVPPRRGSLVGIDGKIFRGGVLLRVEDRQIQAINVVDMEEYLRGVVAAEMPASWPASALAAQSIIARTYAAARINPKLPFDTCSTQRCQVYNGVVAERAQTDKAIRKTKNQVVSYRGKPAATYFSSDSGGYTASSSEVWGMNLAYLKAQPDPFSQSALGPQNTWEIEVPLNKIEQEARRFGVKGNIQAIRISKTSQSGRPQEIVVNTEQGAYRINGSDAGGFIRALGANSTRVTISGLDPMTITGNGQGHGVGFSQYGALGMARFSYDYLHMLGFYYPGTVLSALVEPKTGGNVVLKPILALPKPDLPASLQVQHINHRSFSAIMPNTSFLNRKNIDNQGQVVRFSAANLMTKRPFWRVKQ